MALSVGDHSAVYILPLLGTSQISGQTDSVKDQNCWYTKQGCRLDWYPSIRVLTTCCQLRFSHYSGTVITKALAAVVSFIQPLVSGFVK